MLRTIRLVLKIIQVVLEVFQDELEERIRNNEADQPQDNTADNYRGGGYNR